MSTTTVTYPIVAALVKAEDILGLDRLWEGINSRQQRFLREFFAVCHNEIAHIPEIESIASWQADEVNAFLRKRGFTIQLDPFDDQTFGVASVLDLLVEWLQKGGATVVITDDCRQFPGVRIDVSGVEFYTAPSHAKPIACLKTRSGDEVYMTMLERPPEGFDLVAKAEHLSHTMGFSSKWGGLVFPMVDLDQKVDISWLLDMRTMGDDLQPAWITQALQQTILKMNEVGARAKSAVAIAVTRGMSVPKPDHIIDRPFLVWFERKGLNKPLFVGHITEDDWKNPGSIT